MPATARLKDIVDALEGQMEDDSAYLDLRTGEVHIVPRELLGEAEELEDDEEPETISTSTSVRLRKRFHSQRSDRIREELLEAIHGRGAFRSFKSAIHRNQIEKAWFAYRDEALRDCARLV